MTNQIENLVGRIKNLESELIQELHKKEKDFFYVVIRKKVRFEREVRKRHKTLAHTIRRYMVDAAFLNILTAPVIWFCLIPGVFLDLTLTVYQTICPLGPSQIKVPVHRMTSVGQQQGIVPFLYWHNR